MEQILPKDFYDFKPKEKEPGIYHVTNYLSQFFDYCEQGDDVIHGNMTPDWSYFNNCFGGARGELVVITADTGMGKSTFARNWLRQMLKSGVKSGLISLEDQVNVVLQHFAAMEVGSTVPKKGKLKEYSECMNDYPLYILDHEGPAQLSFIKKAVGYFAEKLEVKYLILDHMGYIRPTRGANMKSNQSEIIEKMMQELVGLANQYGITIVVISHPAKLSEKGIKSREVGLDEMKGSSAIKQEAQSVLGVYRPDMSKNDLIVRILKMRNAHYGSNRGKKIYFEMDPRTLLLHEQERSPDYE